MITIIKYTELHVKYTFSVYKFTRTEPNTNMGRGVAARKWSVIGQLSVVSSEAEVQR